MYRKMDSAYICNLDFNRVIWPLCVTDAGAARKGAGMFPAVLQWRNDRPCRQKGGGGGEHSE